MKKALFIANFNSFHRQFNLPYINQLKEKGFSVSLVSGGGNEFDEIEHKYDISFERTPFKLRNLKSFLKLRKIYDTYYDIIYISTSVTGAFARLALIGKKQGRIIYSAHGYNFYMHNGKLNGKIYLYAEKILCHMCDCIFTMNQEDYQATLNNNFKCKEVYNVDGVGINTNKFVPASISQKTRLKEEYGYDKDSFILFYAAELTNRKNQQVLFEIVRILVKDHDNFKLLLAGDGVEADRYKSIVASMGIGDYVDFLGYRKDIKNLLAIADIITASSLNEGLPINVIEGLASGLPVIATNVRGHVDLIENGINGYLFKLNAPEEAAQKISDMMKSSEHYAQLAEGALSSSKKYDILNVLPQYNKIFGI